MSKPDLPEIAQSVKERAYKPSGKYTTRSLVLMIGLGVFGGALIGAMGHYVGLLLPLLAGLVFLLYFSLGGCLSGCGYGGCASLGALLSGIVIAGGIGLVYPAIVGAIIGYVTWSLAKWGKCRNSGWAGRAGFLNSVIGYGIFALIAILTSGMMHTTSGLETVFKPAGTEWWLYVLFALDALIFIGFAILISYNQVESTPFCEDCEEWYGDWKQATFSPRLAESLMQMLDSGQLNDLESNITQMADTEYPHLVLKMRKCPSCTTSDFQLEASIFWQEEKTENGKTKTEQKSDTWFTTMVLATLGFQLEELLFKTEQSSSDVNKGDVIDAHPDNETAVSSALTVNEDYQNIQRCDRVHVSPDPALLSSLKMGDQAALQRALMMRNQAALAAIEETIATYSGKSDSTFYQVGGLRSVMGPERQAAWQKLQELAREKQLLDDPAYSQYLIATIGSELNNRMMDELSSDVQTLYDYQLLGVHMQIAATLK